MRTHLGVVSTVLLLAACGGGNESPGTGAAPAAGAPAAAAPTAPPAAGSTQTEAPPSGAPAAAASSGPALGGRTGELVNPDNNTMVFLYYDLTGIAPPIDSWVEKDSRVQYVPAIEKAAQRVAVKSELEAGVASVRGVGFIRLSLNGANLSDYDPTYGEFTVRALAPSSVVEFDALGQKVALKFSNGRTAQIWKVPQSEAQYIRDKISSGGNVELDTFLKITAVQPGPGGGTITTEILEYEMRETRTGTTIARIQIAQP